MYQNSKPSKDDSYDLTTEKITLKPGYASCVNGFQLRNDSGESMNLTIAHNRSTNHLVIRVSMGSEVYAFEAAPINCDYILDLDEKIPTITPMENDQNNDPHHLDDDHTADHLSPISSPKSPQSRNTSKKTSDTPPVTDSFREAVSDSTLASGQDTESRSKATSIFSVFCSYIGNCFSKPSADE